MAIQGLAPLRLPISQAAFPQEIKQPQRTPSVISDTLSSLSAPAVSFCLKTLWEAVFGVWNAFFKSIQSLFAKKLTPQERENRLRVDEKDIQARLARESQHAQNQMLSEADKSFCYLEDSSGLLHPHEKRIGKYQIGICHFQGRRDAMEDEHLADEFSLKIQDKTYPIQLFGIFDGHGGSTASRYVRDHLRKKMQKTLQEFNAQGLTEVGIWNALKMTFVRLNQDFKVHYGTTVKDYGMRGKGIVSNQEGSTAAVAMILDGKLWTANVGDSRIILDNNGAAFQLTEDAKPENLRYQRGIYNRCGTVQHRGVMRVNGVLGVARAIGDHCLQGAVSARPKITVKPLSEIRPRSHLALCCDGVYDVASTRQVVESVHRHRSQSVRSLARNIVFSAYHAGSEDNLSAMVIRMNSVR